MLSPCSPPGSLEFGSLPGRGCSGTSPQLKALGLSSGSSSASSTRGWSWRPPTRPSSLGMYRDEMKALSVLRGSVSLEHHPPLTHTLVRGLFKQKALN